MSSSLGRALHIGSILVWIAIGSTVASVDHPRSDASLHAAYIAARQAEGRDEPRFHLEREANGLRMIGSDSLEGTIDDSGLGLSGEGIGGRIETRSVRCGSREWMKEGAPPEMGGSLNLATRRIGEAVTEWYLNGPLGIEHGFDIHGPGAERVRLGHLR